MNRDGVDWRGIAQCLLNCDADVGSRASVGECAGGEVVGGAHGYDPQLDWRLSDDLQGEVHHAVATDHDQPIDVVDRVAQILL